MEKRLYVSVDFSSVGNTKTYMYHCPFEEVKVGDRVMVPAGGGSGLANTSARVVSVDRLLDSELSFPVERVKSVVGVFKPYALRLVVDGVTEADTLERAKRWFVNSVLEKDPVELEALVQTAEEVEEAISNSAEDGE